MVDSTIQSKDDSTMHVWVDVGIRFFSVYTIKWAWRHFSNVLMAYISAEFCLNGKQKNTYLLIFEDLFTPINGLYRVWNPIIARKMLDMYFFIFHSNKYSPRYKTWKISKSDVTLIQSNGRDVTLRIFWWLTFQLNFV